MTEKFIRVTDEEDAAITAAALTDENNPPWTEEDLKKAIPCRGGRPPGSGNKEQITLRLDKGTLELFRATGEGWQTRIDAALKDWIREHQHP